MHGFCGSATDVRTTSTRPVTCPFVVSGERPPYTSASLQHWAIAFVSEDAKLSWSWKRQNEPRELTRSGNAGRYLTRSTIPRHTRNHRERLPLSAFIERRRPVRGFKGPDERATPARP